MKATHKNGCTIISAIQFDLSQVLDCGQAFRWCIYKDGYMGVACNKPLYCCLDKNDLVLYPSNENDYEAVWRRYFDFDRDYNKCHKILSADSHVGKGIQFAKGLRLLNQQPFETLISFIISANNNVARIKGIIERICAKYGTPVEFEGQTLYAFPTPEQLSKATEEELAACGSGYRAPYIASAARVVASGYDLLRISGMPYEQAKKELQTFKGVGPKVADCVLLFAYGFGRAFPLDVWVKRVMTELYGIEKPNDKSIREFVDRRFGDFAGLAQQYLFYYARESGLGK